ncbi:MAG TPA: bifunctional phosphoribosylaminoimidazolecarboxamide formyltransferase/IMP cyclohydrolase [Acidimicrobiales bacterium]|nr:bifunctional phosphoribosylaminoimidazolecarboxamide formyltransferase/IMP cyclohydrolase [Acidimicrobiales bacterium]
MPTALLSVYDKTGLEHLARSLRSLGWSLVSSGGTSKALAESGIEHTKVEDVTGSPEMLGGRVKTLHPRIHGGILADRSQASHRSDLETHGIAPIDLVVCNLYPFRSEPSVEMIDIGGPTMVRAAAKNFAHVGVIVDPSDYGPVLDELRREGALSDKTRRRLARAAFAHTAAYDAAIVGWFDAANDEVLPPTVHLALERAQHLRYGENPHQQGARYRTIGEQSWLDGVVQHSGIELSYLNLYDVEAAWRLVHDLGTRPAAAIIKHANPCGAAVSHDLATAYRLAFECDERSAFGGIVAVNGPVDDATCDAIVAAAQADVIIAPGYGPGTIDRLRAKRKNTRLLEATPPGALGLDMRQISGGFLVQEPHRFAAARSDWRVVTKVAPTEEQWDDVELAWRLVGHVKSNAIVLVKGGQAVGIGAGQQNRVESGQIAASKAAGRAAGGACASDAFYPFPDGVEAAAAAGAAVVIQPGGSLRDDEVIAAADRLGLAMVFTGERHFLH